MNGYCTLVVLECSRIIWGISYRMDVVECTKYLPAVWLMVSEVGDRNQGGCMMLCILVKRTRNVCAKVVPSDVRIYVSCGR